MSDSRMYFAGSAAQFSTNGDSARDQNSLDTTRRLKAGAGAGTWSRAGLPCDVTKRNNITYTQGIVRRAV